MPDILDLVIEDMGVHPTRIIAAHMDLTTELVPSVVDGGVLFAPWVAAPGLLISMSIPPSRG